MSVAPTHGGKGVPGTPFHGIGFVRKHLKIITFHCESEQKIVVFIGYMVCTYIHGTVLIKRKLALF